MTVNNNTIKPFLAKDLINPSSEGKLVILGSDIKWLSKEELRKPENKKIKTSLKPILKIAQNANISNLSEREYENVKANFKQLNDRIKNYNDKINKSTIKKVLNSFLSFISGGHLKLTYGTLDAQIRAIESTKLSEKRALENKISHLLRNRAQLKDNPTLALSLIEGAIKFNLSSEAFTNFKELLKDFPNSVVIDDRDKRIPQLFEKIETSGLNEEDFHDFLLALNDEMFLHYYSDKSFMQPNKLHGLAVEDVHLVSSEQLIVLERLFTLSDEKTLQEIKESPFLRQLLTNALNLHKSLEFQSDTFIKSLKSALDKLTQSLPQEEMNQFLLGLNDTMLSFFYSDKSFIKENHLEAMTADDLSKMTDDQKALLSRLFSLSSKETLLDLQQNPALRNILIELFQTYPEFANRDPAELKLFLDETLQKIHGLSKFIETDCLLKVLMFVSQNWEKITTGSIGKMSASRPHIRKIEANPLLPEDIEYDTQKGDIIVKLGELGRGTFNIVKKGLVLQNMEMRAFRKPIEAKKSNVKIKAEKIAEMAESEKKIMLAAKGLPHVVQFHEVYEYTSAKKKTGIMRMELPLYNLGEMKGHLKAIRSNNLDALQISLDMIKGVLGLHERGIIHRDLKPANIFLDGTFEDGKEVKHASVGDLGVSCFIDGDPSRKSIAGTRFYLPPESVDPNYVSDFSQDAWAIGVMLSQMFQKNSPFDSIKNEYQLNQLFVKLADPILNPEPADKTSIDFVIWKLLQPYPAKRMTLAEALPIIEAHLNAEKQKPKTVNV